MSQPSKSTSPWVWVAAGCGCAVLVGVLAIGGMGFFGYRWAKQVESGIKDPTQRQAKVLEVLGAERLPAGYYPVMGLSVPFVMEMAMLSDHELPAGEDLDHAGREVFGERGFIYTKMIQSGRDRQRIQDYFDGKTDDLDALRHTGMNLGRGEVLRKGTLTLPGAEARYVSQRSNVSFHSGAGARSITTTTMIDCPQDSKMRLGIWFTPDPAPQAEEVSAGSADLAGTPADEAALAEFLGHFRFCGAGS
jgi:hypothetical protein